MITATEFYNFVQCPARVYLNLFGDQSSKLPVSDFLQQQFVKGLQHEQVVVSKLKFVKPEYKERDFGDGFRKTLALMKEGADLIYHGVLLSGDLVGEPDLLEKRKGKSKLGGHYYVVKDVKLGLSLKDEYVAQLMFYSLLLKKVQGVMPGEAFVVLGDSSEISFDTGERVGDFKEIFGSLKKVVKGKLVKPSLCSACDNCVWWNYCHSWCVEHDDLSLIHRMTKRVKQLLVENGVKTIFQASRMDVKVLSEVKGLGLSSLERIKNQALSLKKKSVIVLEKPEFVNVKTEFFFDIEGETSLGVDYLFGLLIRENGKEKYRAFLANTPAEEGRAWKEFLDFFKDKKNFVIYHYHNYERNSLKRLLDKYSGNNKIYGKITENMVDLFKVLTKSVILPVESYSVKDVAKFLGFRWSSVKAGGAQSMVWYGEFMKDPLGNLSKLDLILQYNEDDCRATLVVKDFLWGLKK